MTLHCSYTLMPNMCVPPTWWLVQLLSESWVMRGSYPQHPSVVVSYESVIMVGRHKLVLDSKVELFLRSRVLYPTKECFSTGHPCIREYQSYPDPFNPEYNNRMVLSSPSSTPTPLVRNTRAGGMAHDHNAYHRASRLPLPTLSF